MPSTPTDRLRGLTTSVAVKSPVRVASTGNLVLSSTQVIDGIAVSTGDRVLVKDQTVATENGIYEVDSATWSRAADFDGQRDCVKGTLVYVSTGVFYGNRFFAVTSTGINVPDGSSTISLASAGVFGSTITVSTFAETYLDDSSAVDFRDTVGLSGAVITTSTSLTTVSTALTAAGSPTFVALTLTNGQLIFPATQVASAGANTLDDYEEGTWTPTDESGAGLTLTAPSGSYTKIGDSVFYRGRFEYPVTASTAVAIYGGLPFTVGNSVNARGGYIAFGQQTSAAYAVTTLNTATVQFWTPTGLSIQNAALSTDTFMVAGHYRT